MNGESSTKKIREKNMYYFHRKSWRGRNTELEVDGRMR
jgi:hypothetical protein